MTSRTVPLRHLADVRVSNVDKKETADEIRVRLVNYTDVYYGDRIVPDLELMTATASRSQVKAFKLKAGDILITKDSESASDIGVPAFIERTASDLVCGYHLAILRPKPKKIDGRFLYWAMNSDDIRGQMESAATGITRFGLRRDVINQVKIRLPSDAMQHAIVNYLDTETARIDALISKKRRMIRLLEQRWEAWVRNLLGSLKCAVVPLKRYWRVIDCKHRTPTYIDDGYPVVSPGDAVPGRLDLDRAHRFVDEADFRDLAGGIRCPKKGDIIYSRNASIGIASYVDTDAPFCMGQDVCLVTSDNMDQLFLMYVLNSVGLDQLEEQKIGSTFSRVNISQILDIQVPVPDRTAQQALGRTLDLAASRRSRACSILEEQIDLLQERRQALIASVVTGEMPMPRAAG